ncbi:FHA domain-containing protein [Nannocystis pusilla]|uniref:FHA domain-containing protein n=1 Tax=Nannocystis pusilla TaxID=889268 RepID=UPI003BF0AC9E
MGFRLRYLAHELELPLGDFVIGRSTECQLSLDDPLVSRRHAVLSVGSDGVTIEDLGSRNGVYINGLKIARETSLKDGDKITIGSQEMVLLARSSLARSSLARNFADGDTLPGLPPTQTAGGGAAP